jgi:hypothetical protein
MDYMGHMRIVNMAYMGNISAMPDPIYPFKKLVYLSEAQAAAIKDFRFDQRLDSENEAIRQLIQLGLEAAKATKGKTS